MKEVKKGVMDILLYGIVFVVVQLIVSFLGMLVWSFVQHEELADVRTAMLSGHNPVLLALTSVFSSVITLVVFLKTKWTPISRNYLLSKPWLTLLWVALFALGAMIPLEFVYEQIGLEMDETTVQTRSCITFIILHLNCTVTDTAMQWALSLQL